MDCIVRVGTAPITNFPSASSKYMAFPAANEASTLSITLFCLLLLDGAIAMPLLPKAISVPPFI